MADDHWLGKQLDKADREVQSWDAWKRDTMRREATAISSVVRQTDDGFPALQAAESISRSD